MRVAAVVAWLAVVAIAAFSDPLGPDLAPPVAAIEGAELVLENPGSRTVFYFPVDGAEAARILWLQC